MFTRQAVNSLKESSDYEANPRRRFLCRRSAIVDKTYHPSPAKGLISLLKSSLTPSKKTPKKGWKPSIAKNPSSIASITTTSMTTADNCKEESFSYASLVTMTDGVSLTSTISPSASLSPESGHGVTILPGWVKSNDTSTTGIGNLNKSSLQSLPLSPSKKFSSPKKTTPLKSLFRRQPSHSSLGEMMSPYYLDRSQEVDQDISIFDTSVQGMNLNDISQDISQDISYDQYDFDLNHHYDFDLDDDLATERHRYLKGKSVHIDGVEMTAEEEEFTKSFNRIKLDRRPRRTNRRKVPGKKAGTFKIEDKFKNKVSGKKAGTFKIEDKFKNLWI